MKSPAVPPSDADLVQQIRAGSTEVFEELVDRWQRPAFAVAMGIGVPSDHVPDVLQESFVRCLRKLAQLREAASFGPWFLSIVRNVARRQLSDGRRPAMSGAQRTESSTECYADSFERLEFNSYLWSKIHELPDTVREALILYYWEGESVEDVAKALDTSSPAIKNRLHKGREILREKLWREVGGCLRDMLPSTREWRRGARRVSLIALASLPLTQVGAASAASVPLYAKTVGGLAVASKKTSALAVGVILLFMTGFFAGFLTGESPEAAPDLRVGSESEPSKESEARPQIAAKVLQESKAVSENDEQESQESDPAEAAVTGNLRVSVVWAESKEPAIGVRIDVHPGRSAYPNFAHAGGWTDDAGVVFLESLAPGDFSVRADRSFPRRHRTAEVVAGDTSEFLLQLEEHISVTGIVVDKRSRPVSGASIWMTRSSFDSRSGVVLTRSDEEGRFQIRGVQSGRYVFARAEGYAPSRLHAARGERRSTMPLTLMLPGSGGAVSGEIVDPEGNPVANAWVMIGSRDDPRGAHVAERGPVSVRSDVDGRFTSEGMPLGRSPVYVRAAGFAPKEITVEVTSLETTVVRVELENGATLRGRVFDEAGAPIEFAKIYIGGRDDPHVQSDPQVTLVRSDADGQFVATGLMSGRLGVRVSARGKQNLESVVELVLGETAEVNFELSPTLSLRGRVVLESGQALTSGHVIVAGGWEDLDHEGRFLVEDMDDKEYEIHVHEKGDRYPVLRQKVRPGEQEVELIVPEVDRATGHIAGVVTDFDGRRIWGARVLAMRKKPYREKSADSSALGGFSIGPLPAGSYRLGIEDKNKTWTWLDETIELESGETRDVGTLATKKPGSLRVVFSDPGSQEACWFLILNEDELPVAKGHLQADGDRVESIVPGRYRVRISRDNKELTRVEVEVREGEETEIQISKEDLAR